MFRRYIMALPCHFAAIESHAIEFEIVTPLTARYRRWPLMAYVTHYALRLRH